MLTRSPDSYRDIDEEEERIINRKKVYAPRRPWYAPVIDPGIKTWADYADYTEEPHLNQPAYEVPVDDHVENPEHVDTLEQIATSEETEVVAEHKLDLSPTVVSNYSIAHGVNLREAVLVALGGASAALILLLVMAAVFCARRRKNNPSPVPSPPILVYPPHDITTSRVYPPHDITTSRFLTKEINFSLPTLRSTSLGELREVSSVSSLGSQILIPPTPSQFRSHSFTNTTDLGAIDPALYSSTILDEEFTWPDGHVGRIWFTTKYEASKERLTVHILKIKHLPSRTPASSNACDPYIKLELMPDLRSRVLQTKQKKKTCNPFYDEIFVYQIPPGKIDGLTLMLSVYDAGKMGKGKQFVGYVLLPLSELDAAAPDEEPQLHKMDFEKEVQEFSSDLGDMLVSLLYNENLNRLTVTVMEARGVKLDPTSTKREMVARVTQERACRGVRARRSQAVDVDDDGNARVSECFHFRLRPDELHTTSVTVQALQPNSVYAKDRLLGKFVLGSYMFARGRALQHWTDALSSPMEQIQQWHQLNL